MTARSCAPGDRVLGPAVIVEMDSTTLVLPGCDALVDPFGTILINPVKEG